MLFIINQGGEEKVKKILLSVLSHIKYYIYTYIHITMVVIYNSVFFEVGEYT